MVGILTDNASNKEAFFVASILSVMKINCAFILPQSEVDIGIFSKCVVCTDFSDQELLKKVSEAHKVYGSKNLEPFFKYIPLLEGKRSYKKDNNYRVMTVLTDESLPYIDEILDTIDVPNSIIFIDTQQNIKSKLSKLYHTHIVYPEKTDTRPFESRRKKYYGSTTALCWVRDYYYYDMIRNNTIAFLKNNTQHPDFSIDHTTFNRINAIYDQISEYKNVRKKNKRKLWTIYNKELINQSLTVKSVDIRFIKQTLDKKRHLLY